jgi:diadenosine tetraphosphatase ApaH/serine/threonine PP2A family protein phosphatase
VRVGLNPSETDEREADYVTYQIIDGSVLCVHGGLSPDIRTLDQVRVIARAQEVPHEGAFCGTHDHSSI